MAVFWDFTAEILIANDFDSISMSYSRFYHGRIGGSTIALVPNDASKISCWCLDFEDIYSPKAFGPSIYFDSIGNPDFKRFMKTKLNIKMVTIRSMTCYHGALHLVGGNLQLKSLNSTQNLLGDAGSGFRILGNDEEASSMKFVSLKENTATLGVVVLGDGNVPDSGGTIEFFDVIKNVCNSNLIICFWKMSKGCFRGNSNMEFLYPSTFEFLTSDSEFHFADGSIVDSSNKIIANPTLCVQKVYICPITEIERLPIKRHFGFLVWCFVEH